MRSENPMIYNNSFLRGILLIQLRAGSYSHNELFSVCSDFFLFQFYVSFIVVDLDLYKLINRYFFRARAPIFNSFYSIR